MACLIVQNNHPTINSSMPNNFHASSLPVYVHMSVCLSVCLCVTGNKILDDVLPAILTALVSGTDSPLFLFTPHIPSLSLTFLPTPLHSSTPPLSALQLLPSRPSHLSPSLYNQPCYTHFIHFILSTPLPSGRRGPAQVGLGRTQADNEGQE